MGLLKKWNLICRALVLFSSPFLVAAPPVDLSDFEGGNRNVRTGPKVIDEKDLIFTDNVVSPEKMLRGLIEFNRDTIGRTHPSSKEGKAVLRFRSNYRARFLQYSQNKEWIAVELLNGRRRSWVPAEHVKILDEEYIENLDGRLPGQRKKKK